MRLTEDLTYCHVCSVFSYDSAYIPLGLLADNRNCQQSIRSTGLSKKLDNDQELIQSNFTSHPACFCEILKIKLTDFKSVFFITSPVT